MKNNTAPRLILSLWMPLLAACHSGGGGPPAPAPAPAPAPIPPAPATTILSGAGGAVAAGMLPTSFAAPVAAADRPSDGYLLTRLVVLLAQGATVDQLNAAARAVGATRIAASANGEPLLTVEVPRQASSDELISLARTLAAQPGISAAWAGQEHASNVLPEESAGVPVSPSALRHLLPTRFPQAWNARTAEDPDDCFPRHAPVYVLDSFGPVSSSFLLHMNDDDFDSSVSVADTASGHGYDVSLVLAAQFDRDAPTGALPFADCALLTPIEAAGRASVDEIEALIDALRAEPEHFVLNYSMGDLEPHICGAEHRETCTAANSSTARMSDLHDHLVMRIAEATYLARRLASLNAADRLLVVTSAGNNEDTALFGKAYRGFRDARFNNMFTIAAHLADVDTLLQDPELWTSNDPTLPDDIAFDSTALAQLHVLLSPFGNVAPLDPSTLLIADSGEPAETADAVRPSEFDFLNADVRAVAADVPLVTGARPGVGTSFAAPQIAGLAAYLWTISDDLARQPTSATAAHIVRTSRRPPPGSAGLLAVPLADAYQAVLSLDQPNGPLKIRRALLDANGDTVFDHLDLQLFAAAYRLADPDAPTIPTARDFSRYDLNGDGYTGGIPFAAFDLDVRALDANGRGTIETVDQSVEGYEITFNEPALSDLQILCYYAYAGSSADQPTFYASRSEALEQRTALLGPDHCVGARADVQAPATISTTAPVSVTISVPDGGSFVPAPNVFVNLTPTCGTVSPTSGRTDAQGALGATLTRGSGCSTVGLDVVASADPGSTPLATASVSLATTGDGLFDAQENYRVAIEGVERGTDTEVFPPASQTASNERPSALQPGPVDVSQSGTYLLSSDFEPSQYSVEAHGDGPISFPAASSGTYTGSASCAATGTAANHDGQIVFTVMPQLHASYVGEMQIEAPAAGLSFSVNGTLARTGGSGSGSETALTGQVMIGYDDAGGVHRNVRFELRDDTAASVPFEFGDSPMPFSQLTVDWSLDASCWVEPSQTSIDVARHGTLSLSYQLSN